MLKLEAVSKRFGGLAALDGVDMTVEKGQIVGLIGPNGAGKTTLINCISGLDHPTSGDIAFVVNGNTHQIEQTAPHVITDLGLARTFQNIRLLADMSVYENLKIAAHRYGKATLIHAILMLPQYWEEQRQSEARIQNLLSRFGLAEIADNLAGNLSYGDQRRLEMARALMLEPNLILLDEPTAGMNAAETHALGEQILQMREDGLTVLVIEHDMSLISQVCDFVYVLSFGQIIATGTPQEVRENPTVIEAYLGEEDET